MKIPEIEGIREWRNPKNGFYVMRVHYLAHSGKKSAAWKVQAKQSIPPNDWNREMEIDFASFAGKPVFLFDYDPATMFVKCELDPKAPIIRAWDFGYHHPAVCWSQFIDGIQLQILESDMGTDIDFRMYARHIQHLSSVFFPGRKFMDCCDRAGDFKNAVDMNEVKILRTEFGVNPVYKYFRVEFTIDEVRKLMHTTHRRRPCFLVNDSPSNQLLNDALRGGYHYEQGTQRRPEKEEPFQDHFYENIIDPVRYTVANFLGKGVDFTRSIESLAMVDIPEERIFEY